MPAAAPRIHADFNGLVRGPVGGRVSVVLDTYGSARDLSNAGIVLEEGLARVACDESDAIEDLEVHGTARYDRFRRGWVVESDERGVMYVPAVDRSRIDPGFHFGWAGRLPACRRLSAVRYAGTGLHRRPQTHPLITSRRPA
jgi:hypothetical protein|nr:hypothetical protein [uncultured Pseudoxanthomonas sp.]